MSNFCMMMIVVTTWARCYSIFMVIEKSSKLLITINEMITSSFTFIFIQMLFMFFMLTFAMGYMQEHSIQYADLFYTLRTLFDGMMGGYSWGSIDPGIQYVSDFFLIIYISIANIFMLNYLIAIMGSVYEDMLEKGDFLYKVKRYQYIERYMIAF